MTFSITASALAPVIMDDVFAEDEISPIDVSKRFTLDPLSVAGVVIGIGQSIYTAFADGTDNRFVHRALDISKCDADRRISYH